MTRVSSKKIALGIAGVCAALLFGYCFSGFIAAATAVSFLGVCASAALFLSLFLIQVMVAADVKTTMLFVVLEIAAISVFQIGNFSPVLGAGILAGAGFLIMAYYGGVSEIKSRLDIEFTKTSRVIMGSATLALALFASFAYVNSFDLKNPAAARKNLEVIIKPAEPIVSRYIPNFSTQNTLREIAAKMLPASERLSSPADQANTISQISVNLTDALAKLTGARIAPTDRVIDVVYKATLGKVVSLPPLTQTIVLIAFGVIFFFFIKFILFFVDWAAVGIGYGWYRLLKAAGFFAIEMQNVPKRVIVIQ